MKLKTTFLTLNNGTQICAPEDINLMTNFVLQEQGDWFEDEIHFVRKFIQPGMKALDIGANYGLYSTAIATGLGSDGKLWCFEPTQNTADALRQTISINNLDETIELIQAGLSDHIGQATFYTSENAELNSLTSTTSTTGEKQTIDLLTLDHCFEKYQWDQLDFIKLDAEGEEVKILKAAEKTLSTCSPLVLFELKHGSEVNMPLISAFENLGYDSYYLIPGLNALYPLDLTKAVDQYQLNLFCCKKETADKLSKSGLLIKKTESHDEKSLINESDFFNNLPFSTNIQLTPNAPNNDTDRNYQFAFKTYAHSRDESLNVAERLNYLQSSFEYVKKILASGESKIERLSTLARISYDIGQRKIGNQIIRYIIQQYIEQQKQFGISEVFVPPCSSFETIDPKGHTSNWILSSVVEQFIIKLEYSCYFMDINNVLPLFGILKRLDFLQPTMAQRLSTIEKRAKTH